MPNVISGIADKNPPSGSADSAFEITRKTMTFAHMTTAPDAPAETDRGRETRCGEPSFTQTGDPAFFLMISPKSTAEKITERQHNTPARADPRSDPT